MAVFPPRSLPIPVPGRDEVAALHLVEAYLIRTGTFLASRLLGCSTPDAVVEFELSNALLQGAALCAGLRELADAHDHRRRL